MEDSSPNTPLPGDTSSVPASLAISHDELANLQTRLMQAQAEERAAVEKLASLSSDADGVQYAEAMANLESARQHSKAAYEAWSRAARSSM